MIAGFFITKAVLKRRYVKELESIGWTFVDTPSLSIAYGLNNPPFGHGTDRSVDDQIVGHSRTGVSFQAFRYRSSTSADNGYVVTMRLPHSMPEFYLFPPERRRPLIQGVQLTSSPWLAVASEAAFGRAMLASITDPAHAMASRWRVDLSIDHDQLVALNAPRKVDELSLFVDALATIHAAVLRAGIEGAVGEPAPQHLSFYRRPHWVYEPRNDEFLHYVSVTGGGKNHQAHDIIHSQNNGLPFIAIRHTWQTESTSTDAKGRTTTRTRNHEEEVLEFQTPFPFRPLGVNRGSGERVRFESEAFNKAFKVRCGIPRFASDVLHPRQLEHLLLMKPYPFEITPDGRVLIDAPSAGPDVVDFMSNFLHGFFGRVPDFTWKELGAWPRPINKISDSGL